jgi:predicted dienelactone hydrolase
MENRQLLWTVIWLCSASLAKLPTAAWAEGEYKKPPPPFAVKTVLLDWNDPARDRDVPVKIYYPDVSRGTFPVIIFSHGVGGTRDGYAYLGEFWAGFGYVCVHIQHKGSDDAVWRGSEPGEVISAMRKATVLPQNILNRPLDVKFAIDQLEELNKQDPLFKGRLDLNAIGVAGHSFGAFTSLAVAGELFRSSRGATLAWRDPRVKAAIAMSESAPKNPQQWDQAFAKIAIPMLHMTGTLDDSPVGESKAGDRRVPFDHIPAVADQYLIVLQGGDHMVFSGRVQSNEAMAGTGNPAMDPTFQVLIQQSTTAFWDAYLKDDEGARKWLGGEGCKGMLGQNADLEIKPGKAG